MVMGNALWQLIKQSDTISQLVLLTILVMSIVCWTLFFYKIIILRIKKRQLDVAIARLRSVNNLEGLLEAAAQFSGTITGYFLSNNLSFLKSLLEIHQDDIIGLNRYEWDLMEEHTHQTVEAMIQHEEAYQSILSTCAAVSPLLGLFGTVWGLIHAFIRISEKQTADIATVAPGIAEALITTLAGLVVAIPALVMFSYIQAQVQAIEQRLILLADRFNFVLQKQLVR